MNKNPRDVVVVAAVRTAVGKASKGSLKDTRPDDLLAEAIRGLLAKLPGFDPAQIDDVVVGCAFPEGEQGMNVARMAALSAGIPHTVPAMTVNRFCSSGLQSLAQSAAHIQAGWYDIALTGGIESMSQIPMGGDRPTPNPTLMQKRPEVYTPMGVTSEIVAERFQVSREDQDVFAASSHHKAAEGHCRRPVQGRDRAGAHPRVPGRRVEGDHLRCGRGRARRHDGGGLGQAQTRLRREGRQHRRATCRRCPMARPRS